MIEQFVKFTLIPCDEQICTFILSNKSKKNELQILFKILIDSEPLVSKKHFHFLGDRFLQKYNFEKKNLSLFVFSRDCGPKHTQVEIQTGMIIEMGAFEFFSFRSFIFVNNPFRSFFSIVQTLLISFHFLLQSFIKNSSFKRITRKPS